MDRRLTGVPDMDRADVRRAYDTVAADYAALLPDTAVEAALDLAMIDEFVTGSSAHGVSAVPRILDAGCGAGRMSAYLRDRGCAVEGVDLSPAMIECARRDHPAIAFDVAALTDLPHPDRSFDGVLLWYSSIHTEPAGLPVIWAEVARVVRPGGSVLVGFQSGEGVRDVAPSYRAFGHEVRLVRHLTTADAVAAQWSAAGLSETARLVRRTEGHESDDQTILLGMRNSAPSTAEAAVQ